MHPGVELGHRLGVFPARSAQDKAFTRFPLFLGEVMVPLSIGHRVPLALVKHAFNSPGGLMATDVPTHPSPSSSSRPAALL